jgi:hypothetical protein
MKKDLQSKSEQLTRRSFLREGAAAIGGLTVVTAASETSGATARPLDWLETSAPEHWQGSGKSSAQKQWRYRWSGTEGASAFLSP